MKQALQAGSAVSTLVGSEKAQGVDRPAPTASSHQKRRAAERQARVCGPSAYGKRVLKRLNDVQTGQGYLFFVAAEKVALQTFGKEIMEPMSATALMFFNCWQRACETCTSKVTPIMIRWKHW